MSIAGLLSSLRGEELTQKLFGGCLEPQLQSQKEAGPCLFKAAFPLSLPSLGAVVTSPQDPQDLGGTPRGAAAAAVVRSRERHSAECNAGGKCSPQLRDPSPRWGVHANAAPLTPHGLVMQYLVILQWTFWLY